MNMLDDTRRAEMDVMKRRPTWFKDSEEVVDTSLTFEGEKRTARIYLHASVCSATWRG